MTKLGSLGSKKQAILLGVLAVVLVLAVVRWRPGGGGAPAPAASATNATNIAASQGRRSGGQSASAADEATPAPSRAASRSGSRTKEVQADDVPILDPDDFKVKSPRDGVEVGRDLFGVPMEPTRKPPPTPYPPPPPPGDARFIGPLPAPGPTPTPKPPEVSFKFVGTFGPKGHPIAVIQEGDKVYNVRAGDVLFDKFVLRSVGYESIDIGFVGYPETESRRIGITPN